MRSLSVLQLLSPKPTELPSTTSPRPSQPSQHRIVGKGKHVPCQAGSERSRGGHAGYEGVPPVILSPGGSGTVERPPEIVFPFYAGAATAMALSNSKCRCQPSRWFAKAEARNPKPGGEAWTAAWTRIIPLPDLRWQGGGRNSRPKSQPGRAIGRGFQKRAGARNARPQDQIP